MPKEKSYNNSKKSTYQSGSISNFVRVIPDNDEEEMNIIQYKFNISLDILLHISLV